MRDLTQLQARDALDYNPSSGQFRWRHSGGIAGHVDPTRTCTYRVIVIRGQKYYAHRLAWLYMKGEWPPSKIDHVNGDGIDNKWGNLRLATDSENSTNAKLRKTNSTGYKGVCYNKRTGQAKAQIQFNGVVYHLGSRPTPELAHALYVKASKKIHKQFSRIK